MASNLAGEDMKKILARLHESIKESGHSLRGLARLTDNLDYPERLHHSNLSEILRGVEGRDLYLQTFLSICKQINVDPLTFLVDAPEAAMMVRVMTKLSGKGRKTLLRAGLAALEAENVAVALQQRLRQSL